MGGLESAQGQKHLRGLGELRASTERRFVEHAADREQIQQVQVGVRDQSRRVDQTLGDFNTRLEAMDMGHSETRHDLESVRKGLNQIFGEFDSHRAGLERSAADVGATLDAHGTRLREVEAALGLVQDDLRKLSEELEAEAIARCKSNSDLNVKIARDIAHVMRRFELAKACHD